MCCPHMVQIIIKVGSWTDPKSTDTLQLTTVKLLTKYVVIVLYMASEKIVTKLGVAWTNGWTRGLRHR